MLRASSSSVIIILVQKKVSLPTQVGVPEYLRGAKQDYFLDLCRVLILLVAFYEYCQAAHEKDRTFSDGVEHTIPCSIGILVKSSFRAARLTDCFIMKASKGPQHSFITVLPS